MNMLTTAVPLDLENPNLQACPLEIHREKVQPEWIDYNGHMNVAYYVLAFDHATDRMLDLLDLGLEYVKRENKSFFVLETHVAYLQEVKRGDPLRFTVQLLDYDAKRLHYFLEMGHADEGFLAATSEIIGVHVDLDLRRSAAMPAIVQKRLALLAAAQKGLPVPDKAGASIGIRRK